VGQTFVRGVGDAEPCDQDTGDKRNDHNLEMGRAISAVDRVVHWKSPAAFRSANLSVSLAARFNVSHAGNVGIRCFVPKMRSQGSEKT
jgi:hypothetical protein